MLPYVNDIYFFSFWQGHEPAKAIRFCLDKDLFNLCENIFTLIKMCSVTIFFTCWGLFINWWKIKPLLFLFFTWFIFFCYQFPIVNLTGKKQKRGINTDVQLMRTYEKINIYLSFIKFVYVPCSENKRSIIFCDQFWGELIKWDNFPCSNFYHDLTERCVTQHRERRKYKLSVFKLKANKYFTFAVVHVMCQSRRRGRGLHVIKGKGMLVGKN